MKDTLVFCSMRPGKKFIGWVGHFNLHEECYKNLNVIIKSLGMPTFSSFQATRWTLIAIAKLGNPLVRCVILRLGLPRCILC